MPIYMKIVKYFTLSKKDIYQIQVFSNFGKTIEVILIRRLHHLTVQLIIFGIHYDEIISVKTIL